MTTRYNHPLKFGSPTQSHTDRGGVQEDLLCTSIDVRYDSFEHSQRLSPLYNVDDFTIFPNY